MRQKLQVQSILWFKK